MPSDQLRDPAISGPQRTSPRTLISAGVSIAAGAVFIGFQLSVEAAVSAGTGSSRSNSQGPTWLFALIAAGLLLQGISVVLSWFMRTYTVTATELVIDEGVFTRHHRVIPFARVQQVDLEAKLTAQILDIRTVKISSAGEAGATTITLHALNRNDGESLRSYILRRREELHRPATGTTMPADRTTKAGTPPGSWVVDGVGATTAPPPVTGAPGSQPGPAAGAPPPPTPPVELLRLAPGRLVLASLTDFRIIALPAVVLIVALWLVGFSAVSSGNFAAGVAGVLVIGTVVVLVPLITAGQVIEKYGFTVTARGDDLHLRYGLFEVRELTVPRRRVQHITVIDNPLRRALGIASLRLHSASISGGQQSTSFDIPVVPTRDLDSVLRGLMASSTWHVPTLTPRSDRARFRAVIRRTMLLAVVLAGPAIMLRPNGPLLLLVALAGVPWGFLAHRRAGHGRTSTIVAFAHGALHHRTDLVPIDRIQSSRAESSPFQRRAHLTTLLIDVAAAQNPPHLFDIDGPTASDLIQVLPRSSSPTATVDQGL